MSKRSLLLLLTLSICCLSPLANAGQLIQEYSGSDSINTEEFEAHAPWIVEWLVSGDPSRWEAIDVTLMDAGTDESLGVVLQREAADSGVQLFNQSGVFYFVVNSTMFDWNLKVTELTEEEAKAYTPKSDSMLNE